MLTNFPATKICPTAIRLVPLARRRGRARRPGGRTARIRPGADDDLPYPTPERTRRRAPHTGARARARDRRRATTCVRARVVPSSPSGLFPHPHACRALLPLRGSRPPAARRGVEVKPTLRVAVVATVEGLEYYAVPVLFRRLASNRGGTCQYSPAISGCV